VQQISIGRIVGRTYAFAFRRYFSVVGIVWLPLALLFGGATQLLAWFNDFLGSIHPLQGSYAMQAVQRVVLFATEIGHIPTLRQLAPSFTQWLPFVLIEPIFVAIVSVGIVKEVLGKRKGPRIAYFWFGLEEFFVAATNLLFVGAVAVFAILAALSPIAKSWVAILLLLVELGIPFLLLHLTFFSAPVAVAERRFGLFRSFSLTRGYAWRLIGILFLTYPAIFALDVLFVFGQAAIDGLHLPPIWHGLAAYLLSLLVLAPMFALLSASTAFTYRELVPENSLAPNARHAPKTVSDLTFLDVLAQFKKDVFDKEVQSAATYSYLWLADQMAHIGLGLVLMVVLGLAAQVIWGPPLKENTLTGIYIVVALLCLFYEVEVYRAYSAKATGRFQPDRRLLAENAAIAVFFMFLGAQLGWAWDRTLLQAGAGSLLDAHAVLIGALVLTVFVAFRWVRQKIVWQKAGMPYLSRLANIDPRTISSEDAEKLEDYLDAYLHKKDVRAAQTPVVVVEGPINASKTELACAIGTHAAFKNLTVRYVTFNKLAQMAAMAIDDRGPPNIVYWKWDESEVVVIDDIHSGSHDKDYADLDEFKQIVEKYGLRGRFNGRITVWVLGPKNDEMLPAWQEAIMQLCRSMPAGIDPEPELLTLRLKAPAFV
jgi:hypothetical protein